MPDAAANPDQPRPQRQQYKINLRNPADNPYQLLIARSPLKRKIVRAGRRGGKTTVSAIIAVEAFLKGRRVLYAAPTIDQVEKFWTEVKRALDEPIRYKVLYKNETKHIIQGTPVEENELDVERKRDPRIRAKTAFNAQTLRGDYADLLILDEWQMMDETAWTEVGSPMLIDNNGDVVFIYTPPSLETRSASKASDPLHAAKMFKEHKDDPYWLCVHFPSSANPHLSREGLDEAARNMTALAYRQEILALDTEEVPGALWTRKIIEDSRVKGIYRDGVLRTANSEAIEMRRIVVAIDPSGGNTTEVGIMTGGEGANEHVYVMRDSSMKAARPKDWAECAIGLYLEFMADRVIAEKNYGGDMVEETLRNVDESVSYKAVDASRGKLVRAEPVLALFQQNRMHLVCSCGKASGQCTEFAALEEELCSYTAKPGQKSPNRLDAMVWLGVELSGAGSLGLLDLFKSGRAEKLMGMKPAAPTNFRRPAGIPIPAPTPPPQSQGTGSISRVAGASTMAAVATDDKTPRCPNPTCGSVALQSLGSMGGEMRCQACGTQFFPNGAPDFQRPLGGRRITLEK